MSGLDPAPTEAVTAIADTAATPNPTPAMNNVPSGIRPDDKFGKHETSRPTLKRSAWKATDAVAGRPILIQVSGFESDLCLKRISTTPWRQSQANNSWQSAASGKRSDTDIPPRSCKILI